MSNPYSAPTADLAVDRFDRQEYQPRIFALRGRIGRLRYWGYSLALSLTLWLAFGVLGLLLALTGKIGGQFMNVVPAFLGFAIFAVSLIPAKRRLNDLNRSGWLALLMLIPLINFFMGLYLLFGRGTDGENDYGAMPCKNPRALAWVAVLIPIVIVGVLAAIAIPAYQGYVAKSRAAAMRAQLADPAAAPVNATQP